MNYEKHFKLVKYLIKIKLKYVKYYRLILTNMYDDNMIL